MSFNKDIIWRKKRWAIHLGSEGLICLAGRELQIHRLMTLAVAEVWLTAMDIESTWGLPADPPGGTVARVLHHLCSSKGRAGESVRSLRQIQHHINPALAVVPTHVGHILLPREIGGGFVILAGGCGVGSVQTIHLSECGQQRILLGYWDSSIDRLSRC